MRNPPTASDSLTPAEIAGIIAPANHPQRLSAAELDSLTSHLGGDQLDELVDRLGPAVFAHQLPPILNKLMLALQRVAHEAHNHDNIDTLIRNFEEVDLETTATPPHSSPEPPTTPPVAAHVAQSQPASSQRRTEYICSTPTPNRPAKVVKVVSWFEAGALTMGIRGAGVNTNPKKARPRKPPAVAFVIFFGGCVCVCDSWAEVLPLITGHGLAIHCGFRSRAAAEAALKYARERGWTGDSVPPPATDASSPLPLPSSYDDNPLNSDSPDPLWYVVCRGVAPGIYRSYLECSLNTSGVKGNLCNAFDTQEEAESAFAQASRARWVRTIPRARPLRSS